MWYAEGEGLHEDMGGVWSALEGETFVCCDTGEGGEDLGGALSVLTGKTFVCYECHSETDGAGYSCCVSKLHDLRDLDRVRSAFD